MNLRFHLSKIVPMPMRSDYGLFMDDAGGTEPRRTESYRTRWVQWRGRTLWQRTTIV